MGAAIALAALLGSTPPVLAMPTTIGPIGTVTLVQARVQLGMRAFVTGVPRCQADAKLCFGLVVHVVEVDGAPVVDPVWFFAQVDAANRLFDAIDVAFESIEVRRENAERAHIASRSDRDRLGRGEHDKGVVHVWIVRRLADVDIDGAEIRGVHWRDRADLSRRFVILSSIAGDRTLAHELGHFFGLPHSRYPVSIMNKTPRDDPPWELRGFHRDELSRMRRDRDEMVADGTLVQRKQRRGRPRRR